MKDSTKKFILTKSGLPFYCPVTSPAGMNLIAAIPAKTVGRQRCADWIAANWRTVEPILSRRFPIPVATKATVPTGNKRSPFARVWAAKDEE